MHIMLISLRFAPPEGAIGASLVVKQPGAAKAVISSMTYSDISVSPATRVPNALRSITFKMIIAVTANTKKTLITPQASSTLP